MMMIASKERRRRGGEGGKKKRKRNDQGDARLYVNKCILNLTALRRVSSSEFHILRVLSPVCKFSLYTLRPAVKVGRRQDSGKERPTK
jgi:hypothetical protein